MIDRSRARRIPGRALAWAALAATSLFAVACKEKLEVIEFDQRFSLNLVKVPDWFPGKAQNLSPAQQEVIQRRGAPDFIRFWWRPDGEIVTSSDFAGKREEIPKMLQTTKQTWIYSYGRDKAEIEFYPNGGYDAHPLTERLELLCQNGDPTQKNPARTNANGKTMESWIWMDRGLMIEMADGKVVSRRNIVGTGDGTKIK